MTKEQPTREELLQKLHSKRELIRATKPTPEEVLYSKSGQLVTNDFMNYRIQVFNYEFSMNLFSARLSISFICVVKD